MQKQIRTFSTMTVDLLASVFNLLEEQHTILLVNPQHMKAVPGRKTDAKDSEWSADLLRHGLLQASFIPPQPIRAIRTLTRYRKTLIQERAEVLNRLQKVLEGANIKLAAVATDILGLSGRAMLEAMVHGEQDADLLAELARGKLRAKLPQSRQVLDRRLQPPHRFLIKRILAHIDSLEASLALVQQEIEQALRPFEEAMALIESIVGIHETAAAAIVAEIGVDMLRLKSARLASWAGVCPGNKQSEGNASVASPPKGIRICMRSSLKSSGPSLTRKTTISLPNITTWLVVSARRKRW